MLADELTIEPDVLDRWRGGDADTAPVRPGAVPAPDAGPTVDVAGRRCWPRRCRCPLDVAPRATASAPSTMAATTDPRDADVAAAVAAAIGELRTR